MFAAEHKQEVGPYSHSIQRSAQIVLAGLLVGVQSGCVYGLIVIIAF